MRLPRELCSWWSQGNTWTMTQAAPRPQLCVGQRGSMHLFVCVLAILRAFVPRSPSPASWACAAEGHVGEVGGLERLWGSVEDIGDLSGLWGLLGAVKSCGGLWRQSGSWQCCDNVASVT